jgi:hypothetical protein
MKPRWYVPLLLLTLFAPSLQLFFVLIHSHVGSPESDVDYVIGMKGDFGSLDLDYTKHSSILSSSRNRDTMNELAKSSSIHPIKTMYQSQPSLVKSGNLNGGMYDGKENPHSEGKCLEIIRALKNKLKNCKGEMAKQKARHDKDLHDALQKLSSITKEKQKLQKKLEDTEANLRRNGTTNKLDVSLPVKKELKELLESQAKSVLWGMVKFIQSPADELMAAKMLLKCADNLPEEYVATKEDRLEVANTYKGYIRRAIFQRRNYVAAEHKKVMVKHFKEKGYMPTVSQLVKCLKRDIASDQEYDTFQFYWEELLPKQVGSCSWSKDIRNYTTICEAIRKDITHMNMPTITSEDEAFTVLVVENSYDRWMKEIQEKDDEKRKNDTSLKKTRKPNYNGLYTTTDSGQNEWGGWMEEGLASFNRYVDMNREARKKKTTQNIERTCLARIKQKYNIVCNDHKTQTDMNKKRKRKGDDEPKRPPLTIRPEFHQIYLDEEDNADVAAPSTSDDDGGDGPGSLAVPYAI